MATAYYEKDADLKFLEGKTIAVFGYGSQGHAHALNLRDSGLEVVVGLHRESRSRERARLEGLTVLDNPEAGRQADIMMILTPDEKQHALYEEDLKSSLTGGKVLAFAHGFNIHFKRIVPPEGVDVVLVAPKAPGHLMRRNFREGIGVPALMAVERDASGRAKEIALAYARGIGCAKAGVIETTFREECETDLFGEQCVLCGGLTSLVKAGFETLVAAGYQPEVAFFECLHELKLIVDLMHEGGLKNMRFSISNTARYGDLTRGPRIIGGEVREAMKQALSEIQSGEFAREWIAEHDAGLPRFKELNARDNAHQIEEVGQKLRAMMPWIKGPLER